MRFITALLVVIASVATSFAQLLDEQSVPKGGTVIISSGTDPYQTANLRGGGAADARYESVAVDGQSFARAVRIHTLRQGETVYAVELDYWATQPVRKGDVLLATFAARGEGTMGRDARIEVRLDKSEPAWDEFTTQVVSVRPEWQRFYIPCIAVGDYPAGKSRVSLRVGFAPQQVDIADVQVIDYGQTMELADLPRTRLTYKGREIDAPWRAAAAQRIEQYRKAPLQIRVVDAQGKPVPNAQVQVKMTQQAFPFASAVSAYGLVRAPGPAGDRYRQMVDELFTHVTLEWEACQIPWEQDRTVALDALKWLKDHGKVVHGCHILWPDPNSGAPKDIVAMKDNPAGMRKRLEDHITDKLTACKGLAVEWNALNELYTNRLFEQTLGKEFAVEVFRKAKQVDPTIRLDINDYGDIANTSDAHINGYLDWIGYLKQNGAPVDVVGLQCHFGQFLRSPDDCYAILDRFAAFGYPLHVTELDINTADEQVQADYLRDIMTLLYSHPAVEKITLWGFWESRHWLPKAALWRTDWTIKPNGQAWVDLVQKQWRTNTTLTTDAKGEATVRAFFGDYQITATSVSQTASARSAVGKDGQRVTLTIR